MSGADPRVRAVLKLAPVIPVYTPESVDEAVHVARALFNGGLPVIEVTLRTAIAMDAIRAMVEAVPDAVVGAGTVLTAAQMERVKAVGALRGGTRCNRTLVRRRARYRSAVPAGRGYVFRADAGAGARAGYVQVLPGRTGRWHGDAVGVERPVRRCAVLPDRRDQRADRARFPAPAQCTVRGRFVVDHAGAAAGARWAGIEELARASAALVG